jgi:uncharacterized protein YukE
LAASAHAANTDANGQSADSILQRLKDRVSRLTSGVSAVSTEQTKKSELHPEPCYPPPCDDVGYMKDTMQVTDKSKDHAHTAREISVPAEHLLDPDRPKILPMRFAPTTAPPVDKYEEEILDPVIPNSIVDLRAPPDMYEAMGVDATDPHTPYGRISQMLRKIKRLSKSVQQHDDWLVGAKKTMHHVQEILDDTKASARAVKKGIRNLKKKKKRLSSSN